jgi:hypothetical protein
MEYKESAKGGLPNDTFEGTTQIYVIFNGSTGGQMGGQWHRTSRGIYIFLWKGE